jgi:hypothetical protein
MFAREMLWSCLLYPTFNGLSRDSCVCMHVILGQIAFRYMHIVICTWQLLLPPSSYASFAVVMLETLQLGGYKVSEGMATAFKGSARNCGAQKRGQPSKSCTLAGQAWSWAQGHENV